MTDPKDLEHTDPNPDPIPAQPGRRNEDVAIRMIAYGGIFTALVLLATWLLKIPLPVVGYIHLGDGIIFLSAVFLGPFAAVPAALGSGLADFAAGFPVFIPATVVIKGVMGLLSGVMLRRLGGKHVLPQIGVFLVAEIIMVAGYFGYEWILYGINTAYPNILYNTIQGIAGIVLGTVCIPAMRRIRNNMQASSRSGD